MNGILNLHRVKSIAITRMDRGAYGWTEIAITGEDGATMEVTCFGYGEHKAIPVTVEPLPEAAEPAVQP